MRGVGTMEVAMIVAANPPFDHISSEWGRSEWGEPNSIKIDLRETRNLHILTSFNADVHLPSGETFTYLMQDERDPDRIASVVIEGDRLMGFLEDAIPVVEKAAGCFKGAVGPAKQAMFQMAEELGFSLLGARVLLLSFFYIDGGFSIVKLGVEGMFPRGERFVSVSAIASLGLARQSGAQFDIEFSLPRSADWEPSLKDDISKWAGQALSAVLSKKGVRWKRAVSVSRDEEDIDIRVSWEASRNPDWDDSLRLLSVRNERGLMVIPIPVPDPSSSLASLFADAFSALGKEAKDMAVAKKLASALSWSESTE